MVSLKLAALALAAAQAVSAQIDLPEGLQVEDMSDLPENRLGDESKLQTPSLAVDITTTFPNSEIFGIKLVNNHPTLAHLSIANNEPQPISLSIIGGSLTTPLNTPGAPDPPIIVRNLTASRYDVLVPAGQKESVTYTFTTELHPQELRLNLAAVLMNAESKVFTKMVFNETVSVVEAPMSIFDPQIIFLYLVLAAAFAGTCYFIYNTWITTLFPQKRRGGKGGERAKRSSGGSKKVDPSEQVAVVGADGPAVASASGSKAWDESWIPEGHLKRPEARRVGSGRPKSRAA